ncbi:hypothetical protein [Massilia aquatica]|uniref:Uncharacterized protein n=1 Tax=Massilia aquatica TaxID=2609000 RepID=A0ABX0MD29_9BURK|nr:hypothetical protein [Massilia aquatica]NHZ44274.1 hypothetical protein [Massilia aquatica]
MDISKEQYVKTFSGYIIVDCAIRSKDIFYFSLCTNTSRFPDPDEKLIVADVDSEIKVCSGHLPPCGNVILLAGNSGAAYKQHGVWHKFF